MAGWVWIVLGAIVLGINANPPYQRWVKQRLTGKQFANAQAKAEQRRRIINILGTVYIVAGLTLLIFS